MIYKKEKRMKIGYLRLDHGEWTTGAYNSQELGLAKAFEKMEHDVTIFYCVFPTDERCGRSVEITKHIRKCYLPAQKIGHHALLETKCLDKFEIDLLHIQGDNLLSVPKVVRYCRRREILYYCYVGRLDSEKTGRIHRFLTNLFVLRNIKVYLKNLTFVKTPTVKDKLDKLGAKQVFVAPVGLDLSIIPYIDKTKNEIRQELGLPCNKKIVLCVSRLVKGKQPNDIFELARKLDDSLFYVFIGGWDETAESAFVNRIKNENLQLRFRYINKIPNVEIHQYYKACDILVNFNQNEIFGMSILEAMYQGATVVARKAPGPSFIIQSGISGYIVESIEEMSKMVTAATMCSKQARERVIEQFNWDSTAKTILQKVMEQKK